MIFLCFSWRFKALFAFALFLLKKTKFKIFKRFKALFSQKDRGFCVFFTKKRIYVLYQRYSWHKKQWFLDKTCLLPRWRDVLNVVVSLWNILWLFLKGDSASLLSIININDLTGHVFTLLLSKKVRTWVRAAQRTTAPSEWDRVEDVGPLWISEEI